MVFFHLFNRSPQIEFRMTTVKPLSLLFILPFPLLSPGNRINQHPKKRQKNDDQMIFSVPLKPGVNRTDQRPDPKRKHEQRPGQGSQTKQNGLVVHASNAFKSAPPTSARPPHKKVNQSSQQEHGKHNVPFLTVDNIY